MATGPFCTARGRPACRCLQVLLNEPVVRAFDSQVCMKNAHTLRAHGRAQLAIAYVVLIATCVAGVFHLGWWSAVAGASSLALVSLASPRASAGRGISEQVLVASSLLNASAAASAAYAFGYLARWVWGL